MPRPYRVKLFEIFKFQFIGQWKVFKQMLDNMVCLM